MAKKIINTGTTDNDGTGDSLKAGAGKINDNFTEIYTCLLYTSPSPRDLSTSRMPSSA